MKPYFSIISTTYNRTESGYLLRCIKSIQNQKGDHSYEHIIIDDGSTDKTAEIVAKEAKVDERIVYIHQENSGPATGVKKGIKKAKGQYIIILDDDDMLTENSLTLRKNYIENNPEIDWFYGKAIWIDGNDLPVQARFQSSPVSDHHYERLLIANYINAGTPTVSRKDMLGIEWPEWLSRSQDYFMWLELMRPKKNLKVGFLDDYVCEYRWHDTSYSVVINDQAKINAKYDVNTKIKSLHPPSIAFLADEAFYHWRSSQEAIKSRDIIKSYNTSFQVQIDSFGSSRLLRLAIKLQRAVYLIKKAVSLPKSELKSKIKEKLLTAKNAGSEKIATRLVEKPQLEQNLPIISIVSPFYNREHTMPDTVGSVLSQTLQNFELIVVNDGSSTDSAKWYLQNLKHPKIRVINQTNQGVSAARNKGISESAGQYVMCLDSDDMIEATHIEKAVLILESSPDIDIVTFDTQRFGRISDAQKYPEFDPVRLLNKNIVQTSAVFRKTAWEQSGGYKSNIGYEDWEFWINLTENGFKTHHVADPVFKYRVADESRYIDDFSNHDAIIEDIKRLHPHYLDKIYTSPEEQTKREYYEKDAVYSRINKPKDYLKTSNNKPNVLLALSGMPFGGVESLVTKYAAELKRSYNFSFFTLRADNNKWRHKFAEISESIYHLDSLLRGPDDYLDFVSNYIYTRNIDILHIVHSSYVFDFIDELKQRHPDLKIIFSVFNTSAHYPNSLTKLSKLDQISSDNDLVINQYKEHGYDPKKLQAIDNGVDAIEHFKPSGERRLLQRKLLQIKDDEIAVFFIGRMSAEKSPDKFIDIATRLFEESDDRIRFFMIGEGPMMPQLRERLYRQSKLPLEILGYKDDTAPFLDAADIVLSTSAIEGFPLGVLEAMSMSKAIVASDVGCLSQVIKDGNNGYTYPYEQTDVAVELVVRIAKDADLRKSIGSNARKTVEESYSIQEVANSYDRLYLEALK